MANYLLEIGTEEIPAKFMPGILTQLQELAGNKLKECRIKYEEIRTLGTPRRITLLIKNLAEKEEDLNEEVRGPSKSAAFSPDGRPTKAAEGFARSQGVTVAELVIKDTGNGEYVFARRAIKGRPTKEVLPELVPQLIHGLTFPKPMRWGDSEMRFARPIRWLVSLLDQEVLPFVLDGLKAGRTSRGHRFLGRGQVDIAGPLTYVAQLKQEYVMADQEARRAECWRQIQEAAAKIGGQVEPDPELLEEVTHLLEWPTALVGSFDKRYLQLPEEVVITPMREHQRYFPVRGEKGRLMNYFVTVRNGDASHLEVVRAGNERVLKARLADARFFWEEDLKHKLAEYLPRLEKIVFQESLGTVAQKVNRIKNTVDVLGVSLGLEQGARENAARAAHLAKADLVTNMVYEFPELQGIMGQYYARLSGEKEEVARAILEHYQPRSAGDEIPRSVAGAVVSMADKLDTIAGCFAIGIEPTGSQDPYALRRQAMGICLIIIGHGFELKLADLIGLALDNYRGVLPENKRGRQTQARILEFFQARLRNILADEGHRYDVVDAVLAMDYNSVLDTLARAKALSEKREDPQFLDLLTAYTRANNLAKKAATAAIEPAYFAHEAEKSLYEALQAAEKRVDGLKEKKDFAEIIGVLSTLADPINRFFDAVMVMVEDEKVRNNRLGLLAHFVGLTGSVGDLSKIVVS